MNNYIATFYTHFAAMYTEKNLSKSGVSAKLAPVPRALSSDCGVCVYFTATDNCSKLIHEDFEAVYLIKGDKYIPETENQG